MSILARSFVKLLCLALLMLAATCYGSISGGADCGLGELGKNPDNQS